MKKKLIILLLLILLNVSLLSLPGDVNGDGSLTIVDALMIAQYYVGISVPDFDSSAADINGDSRVSIVDALVVAQIYVGLITPPPTTAPTPGGPTPTPTAPVQPHSVSSNVRVNSIGYLPGEIKGASIGSNASSFSVKRYPGDSIAYSGTVSGQTGGVFQADFTSLNEEGVYYLDVEGVGKSALFEIGPDIYDFPLYSVYRGFYLWRSGTSVSGTHYGTTFSHGASHMNDGYLDYIGGGHTIKDGTGGWYDAGDYGKYIVNAGVTVGMMFKAWEHFQPALENINFDLPESGNNLPDYLDELKWEMDWVLKMQYPDGSGRVSHKLTRTNFSGFIMPENDNEDRFFVPWGSAATADFVAMCAMAARIFQPYDAAYARRCLDAAVVSYNFLADNPSYHAADQSNFSTGAYVSLQFQDKDDRIWAAAEMWETTGEARYLSDFENRAQSANPKIYTNFDWDNHSNLGMITYLMSNRSGKNSSLENSIRNELLSEADGIVDTANSEAHRRPLGGSYYWGCNGGVARQTILLETADRLSPDSAYRDTILDAVNHLFGRNRYNRSYVTGLGFDPPMFPHDRRSGADGITDPWPGYLVGGGHSETDWVDEEESYQTNEVAINWNGALIYALAVVID